MKNLLKLLFPLLLVGATLSACGEDAANGTKEKGQACAKKEECKSGLECTGEEGKKKCTEEGGNVGSVALGAACTKDAECKSGFCFDSQSAHGKVCAKECTDTPACQGADSGLPNGGAGFTCTPTEVTSVNGKSAKICSHHGGGGGPTDHTVQPLGACTKDIQCVDGSLCFATPHGNICGKKCTDDTTCNGLTKTPSCSKQPMTSVGGESTKVCLPDTTHGGYNGQGIIPCKADDTCDDGELTCVKYGAPGHEKKLCAQICTQDGNTQCTKNSRYTCSPSTLNIKKASNDETVRACMPALVAGGGSGHEHGHP